MSHNHNHHEEEKNDFNTISDMPWYRPWLLVGFLALVIFTLVRGCKETFKYETLTVTKEGTDANTHGEHNKAIAAVSGAVNSTVSPMEVLKDSLFTSPIGSYAKLGGDLEGKYGLVIDNTKSSIIVDNPNGIEGSLVRFIVDKTKVVEKTTWFDFDNLNFETGKSVLTKNSQAQLSYVSQILKAYPAVKLKVGAYTDNVGDSLKNVTLSTQRAEATVKSLVALGVDASRLNAEGYGPQHSIADNATEEGRAKNRRVSVRVTEK